MAACTYWSGPIFLEIIHVSYTLHVYGGEETRAKGRSEFKGARGNWGAALSPPPAPSTNYHALPMWRPTDMKAEKSSAPKPESNRLVPEANA